MASISVMKTTVNDEKPRLQTRLQIPGLHALPKLSPMDSAQSARLSDNDGIAIKYDHSDESDRQIYVDILDNIKGEYAELDGNEDFSFSSLGDCGQAPYGYDSVSPCVWIRLNKVRFLILTQALDSSFPGHRLDSRRLLRPNWGKRLQGWIAHLPNGEGRRLRPMRI